MTADHGGPARPGTQDPALSPEMRWTLGCLVGSLATVGVFILVALVAIALSPPTWVQVLLGGFLACGGAVFAWLIAAALGERRADGDADRSGKL